MHVGLNLVYWVPDSGGSGTYAAELIRGLHAAQPGTRITAWVARGAPDDLEQRDWGGPVDWVRLPVRSTGSPVHVPVELFGLGLAARRRGVDVVHGLAYAAPVLAPGVATVVSVLDLTWHHQPQAVTRLARTMFGMLSRLCGRGCDRVIAISEHAADDIAQTLGIPRGKIDVTPLGVRDTPLAAPTPPAELRARLGVPDLAPVVLSVGQIARHKNLAGLIRAFARSRDTTARLVLPGRPTDHSEELEAVAATAGVAERVVLPGYVDDADLEGLFAIATAFVLPSTNEGFGLPVAEAFRHGVPVACSNVSSLPEVAADAALLFNPLDTVAITAAIDRLLENGELREDLARRGRARAAQLTWRRTAELTLESYRRACASA